MLSNPFQYLGNLCSSHGTGICGSGHISGDGGFSGCGNYTTSGLFSGYGLFRGEGMLYYASGDISGYAPGYVPSETPWNDSLGWYPLVTFSGRGQYSGDYPVVTQFNCTVEESGIVNCSGYFEGRNDFRVKGNISGNVVPNSVFSGFGFFVASGTCIVDGCIRNTGYLYGVGEACGSGVLYEFGGKSLHDQNTCSGCFNSNPFSATGLYNITGDYSGHGVYKQHSTSLIKGDGIYTVSGNYISGYSEKVYYGYGLFSGEDISYLRSGFDGLPDTIYGTGYFSGSGWIRGESGFYEAIGTGKGIGSFFGSGAVYPLENKTSSISGLGCINGTGIIYDTDSLGNPTGILCQSTYSNYSPNGCFPYSISNDIDCGNPGTLFVNFNASGGCVDDLGSYNASSEWSFNPYKISENISNPGGEEKADDKDGDGDNEKCPFLLLEPARCSESGLGTIELNTELSSPSGCELFAPISGFLYAGFSLDEEERELITSFPTFPGDKKIFKVSAGTYSIYLSGRYGTYKNLPAIITEEEGLNVSGFSIISSGYSSCNQQVPATILWNGGYTYSINGEQNGYSTSGVSGLFNSSLNNSITLYKDGCETTKAIELTNKNPIEVKINSTGISCQGNGNDGFAQAIISGGHPPYSLFWTNQTGIFSNSSFISGLAVGNYTLTVIDSSGCKPKNPSYLYIGNNNKGLNVNINYATSEDRYICCQDIGTKKANINSNVFGGTPPYFYSWNNGFTGESLEADVGSYYLTITDSSGCSVKSNTLQVSNISDCLNVKWDFGDGSYYNKYVAESDLYNTVDHNYVQNGNYLTRMSVHDNFGNHGTACKNIEVKSCPPYNVCVTTFNGVSTVSGCSGVYSGNDFEFYTSGQCQGVVYVNGSNYGTISETGRLVKIENIRENKYINISYPCPPPSFGHSVPPPSFPPPAYPPEESSEDPEFPPPPGDGGGGGGGDDEPYNPCSAVDLNPNRRVACCTNKWNFYGSVCEDMTARQCCEIGGTPQAYISSCRQKITLECNGAYVSYCDLKYGYCCSKEGCRLDNRCNCEAYGGTFYEDSNACWANCQCENCRYNVNGVPRCKKNIAKTACSGPGSLGGICGDSCYICEQDLYNRFQIKITGCTDTCSNPIDFECGATKWSQLNGTYPATITDGLEVSANIQYNVGSSNSSCPDCTGGDWGFSDTFPVQIYASCWGEKTVRIYAVWSAPSTVYGVWKSDNFPNGPFIWDREGITIPGLTGANVELELINPIEEIP